MAQDVIIQVGADPKTARYHRGALTGDKKLLTPEACNLDDASHVEQRGHLPAAVHGSQLCQRCFGSSGTPESTRAAVRLQATAAQETLAAGEVPDEREAATILAAQGEDNDA